MSQQKVLRGNMKKVDKEIWHIKRESQSGESRKVLGPEMWRVGNGDGIVGKSEAGDDLVALND